MRLLTLLSIAVLFTACRKEEIDDLPVDTAIYQDYKVIFDKPDNRTRAYATFRKSNSLGVRLQLTGDASITFNGNGYTSYTELDNYFYRWNTTGLADVYLRFTKPDGAWFDNRILRADTNDVTVPNGIILSRSNGGQVFWVGRPLVQGETLEAWLVQSGTTTSKTTLNTTGAGSIFIPASITSNLSAGTADLYFNRIRSLSLNEGDGYAGGRGIIEVEARGTVTIE